MISEHRLKFSLGGVLLHAVRFQALVAQAFSLCASECDNEPSLPAGVRAAIVYSVYSHPAEQPLRRVRLQGDVIRYVRSQYRRVLIDLNGSYAEYEKRFSSRRRKHFHQALRRLAAASGGAIDWREYRHPSDMQVFYSLAREVSQTTYQEQLVDAGLPATDTFRHQLAEMAERDSVRGYILFLDQRPIAYQYCPSSGAIITCERIGYDPAYRQHSPGLVLLLLMLESLFAAKCFDTLDLGKGEYAYKETMATSSVPGADIYYFRRTISNLFLVLCHATFESCSTTLSSISERLGLRQRLKRLLRAHYGHK